MLLINSYIQNKLYYGINSIVLQFQIYKEIRAMKNYA